MARRSGSGRSAGRDGRAITRRGSSAPAALFDDEWLGFVRSPSYNWRYIDLTKYEDRRRWHPSNRDAWTKRPGPRGLMQRPRVIVVPEGHRLARLQTYGGKYSLADVYSRVRYPSAGRAWESARERDLYGARDILRNVKKYGRVGFALPWQVVICVRRKRRREVMHALKIAGKRGVGAGKPQRRNEWSEVRC